MKTNKYPCFAALLLLATACEQEEITPNDGAAKIFAAVIEQPNDEQSDNAVRSSVSDTGIFAWIDGDPIAVVTNPIGGGAHTVRNTTLSVAEAGAKGTFSVSGNPAYAVYPQIITANDIDDAGDPARRL